MKQVKFVFLIISFALVSIQADATHRIVNLTVDYKTVNFTGKPAQAIAVNHQIPGPTLHFKIGDQVTINVYNHLNVGTTIHWHGLLVPWQMDGVSGISQLPIPPGGVFHYQFTLHQSGTYWYHAHAGFQEQQGLYGGIIIDPLKLPPYYYNKDFVIVLSDWNNARPEHVYANLKKEGDYYASRFPLQPSLFKFIRDYHKASPQGRKQLMSDYLMMQRMRMSIYDFSDVAYGAYLLNGKTVRNPWAAQVSRGDVVRLRFIDAGASTIFHVKIPHTRMRVVQIDGNNIKPYSVSHFSIAPGETYDVLVSIRQTHPYIIYAESLDTLGHVVGALRAHGHQWVNYKSIKPFPEPAPIRMMNHNKMPLSQQHRIPMITSTPKTESSHDQHSVNLSMMSHSNHLTSTLTTGTKYQDIVAAVKTNNPNIPIMQTIHMDLSGYMDRYIWFINGVPEYDAKPILLKPSKRYRFIFTNHSMMHHPMHIHGHWFILRNGHGAYDPLLHTIDVAPNATVVADVDTDASGQWFFHCHQLYHMMAGMARVFQYSTLIDIEKGKAKPENTIKLLPYANQAIVRVDHEPIRSVLVTHPSDHPPRFFMANFLDADEDPFNNSQEVTYKGLFGSDYNKFLLYMNEAEISKGVIDNADLDMFYWRLISQFWVIKGGANYVYRPAKTPYLQPGIGIEGLMPFFIDTDLRLYYHDGSAKADLEFSRDTLIAHNFFVRTAIRGIFATKTVSQDEIGSGVNEFEFTLRPYYQINPMLAVYLQYQYTGHYDETKRLLQEDNEAIRENRFSLGLSLLL